MNITAPTASPVASSGRTEPSVGIDAATAGPDGTGVAATTDPQAALSTGFGQMLAKRMVGDVATVDSTDTQGAVLASGPDVTSIATTAATPPLDAKALDPSAVVIDTTSAVAKVPGDPRAAGTADKPLEEAVDDSAAGDLAAQLALVSQWTGVAKAVDPSPPGDRAVSGEKSDAMRAANPRDPIADIVATTRGARRVEASTDGVAAGYVPAVVPPTVERAARTSAPAVAASTPGRRGVEAATSDAASVGVPGEVTSSRIEAVTLPTQADATSLAHAFVAQVTSAIGDASSSAAPSAATSTLHQTVGTPAWSHEVGQATLRMAANDVQTASLRMNPEHLGPLDVQVRVDNGVAHIAFTAASAETRQALEGSRTTLDQMFAEQGLKMGGCDVGDTSSRRAFDADPSQTGGSRRDGSGTQWSQDDSGAATSTVTTSIRRALGLVDTFA